MPKLLHLSFVFVITTTLTNFAAAQEWPQFRGPRGNGHADVESLPTKFSETENVKWKTMIPGRGYSSPVISGKQIWMTTALETAETKERIAKKLKGVQGASQMHVAAKVSLRAICVDRDSGKIVKNIPLFELNDPVPIHSLNSYASPTPVIAGDRVFCHFGMFGTACVNMKTAKVEWRVNRFKYNPQNGPGASPVVWKDLLLFNCDGKDVQFVVALDQKTGDTKWKKNRSGKLATNPDFKKAYGTPTLLSDGKRDQLISPGADWVYSYDPASGKELWKSNYGKLGFSTVPKPVAGLGKVYVLTSFMKSRLLAIKTDGSGDVTKSHVAWQEDRNMPAKPSLLLVKGNIYAVNDNGIATCLDAETGEQLWRQRLGGAFSASPLYAGGHIYFFSQDGETVVIKPGKDFEKVATNSLASGFMASPAVADNAMFLRTKTALYRIQ